MQPAQSAAIAEIQGINVSADKKKGNRGVSFPTFTGNLNSASFSFRYRGMSISVTIASKPSRSERYCRSEDGVSESLSVDCIVKGLSMILAFRVLVDVVVVVDEMLVAGSRYSDFM